MDYSSADEGFSDFETYENLNRTITRKPRTIRTRPNHFFMYNDSEFIQRFRLSKHSAYNVLELIVPNIKNSTNWNNALSEEQMLLITLRVYATGDMLMTIGDVNGVSISTVTKVVTRVTYNIAMLEEHFIKFPQSEEEISKAKKEFFKIAKFPKVIAAIDCTHIKIISPGGNSAEIYRNRKGFLSLNVQTTCDANLKITNIVAPWPGSVHDSNILKNSKIYSKFENGEFKNGLIIGDSGYPNKKYLMTPLLNPKSAEETLYNESQIRTRCCIERSYGVWKRRFPILSLGIRLNIKKVQSIIVATAVLHNICCINNENESPSLPHHLQEAVNFVSSVLNNRESIQVNNFVRRALIQDYFKKLL